MVLEFAGFDCVTGERFTHTELVTGITEAKEIVNKSYGKDNIELIFKDGTIGFKLKNSSIIIASLIIER